MPAGRPRKPIKAIRHVETAEDVAARRIRERAAVNKWRLANPEKMSEIRKKNLEYQRIYQRAYRAKKKAEKQ